VTYWTAACHELALSDLEGSSLRRAQLWAANPCTICTYEKRARNSFKISTYVKTGAEGTLRARSFLLRPQWARNIQVLRLSAFRFGIAL
jgi:hypothetical protein